MNENPTHNEPDVSRWLWLNTMKDFAKEVILWGAGIAATVLVGFLAWNATMTISHGATLVRLETKMEVTEKTLAGMASDWKDTCKEFRNAVTEMRNDNKNR